LTAGSSGMAADGNDRAGRRSWPRRWLRWLAAPVATGGLLWSAFPPLNLHWAAWFALVPLCTLSGVRWRSRPIYRPAWAGGLIFGLLAVQWIRHADDTGPSGYFGWIGLALYLSLYFPAFLFLLRVLRLGCRVPAILAVPCAWVGLEWLRGWLFTGFPWYFLAHTQFRSTTLIQIADLFGALGVSFVVATVNGWLFDCLAVPLLRPGRKRACVAPEQLWRAALVVAMFGSTTGYGFIKLAQAPQYERGPFVALIQTNVPQHVKVDHSNDAEIYADYRRLLHLAAAAEADLIVWPETALRHTWIDISDRLDDADLKRMYPEFEPQRIRRAARTVPDIVGLWARQSGTHMLMGLNLQRITPSGDRMYNSAVLVGPDGRFGTVYDKVHLVPWGEYLPLKELMPWLRVFTPHASADYGLEPGWRYAIFELDRWRFGVLICFEDTLPWAARAYVGRPDPVDFLVNISNDGWFAGSAELDAHLAISVFRAVECRRSLVRAVNTGISAAIDPADHRSSQMRRRFGQTVRGHSRGAGADLPRAEPLRPHRRLARRGLPGRDVLASCPANNCRRGQEETAGRWLIAGVCRSARLAFFPTRLEGRSQKSLIAPRSERWTAGSPATPRSNVGPLIGLHG